MAGGKSQDLPMNSILRIVCPHCRMMRFWGFSEIITTALFVLIDIVMEGSVMN